MRRFSKLKTTIIATIVAFSSLGATASADPIFWGMKEFEKRETELGFSLDQARDTLLDHLKENKLEYDAFPEPIILIHENGYLFVCGDFHLKIHLKGYHVSGMGQVSEMDLKAAISVEDYMKLIGRKSWGAWL